MSYRVLIDGADVYDIHDKKKILIDPKITDKLNDSSSFEFKMPPMNKFLDEFQIHVMKSNIFVLDDNDKYIFAGRPSELTWDFYMNIEVYCEGALSYFNDSVQPKKEIENTTLEAFLKTLVTNHNSQVNKDRQFTVGKVVFASGSTLSSKKLYRTLNRETTFDCLKNMILGAEGGYIFTRYENGTNYIDYYEELTETSNQPARYGVNLQDINTKHIGDNVYTELIVYGTDEDKDDDQEVVYSSNPVKNDSLINNFGQIVRTYDAGSKDIWKDQATMKSLADKRLLKHKNDYLSVEATALDLSDEDLSFDPYKIGQQTYIISSSHGINALYPITQVETNLNKRQRIIKTGTETNDDLTEITKQKTRSSSSDSGNSTIIITPAVTLPASISLEGATTHTTTSENVSISSFGDSAYIRMKYDDGSYGGDVSKYVVISPTTISSGQSVSVRFTLYYDRSTGALRYSSGSNTSSISCTATLKREEDVDGTYIFLYLHNCIGDYREAMGDSWSSKADGYTVVTVKPGLTKRLPIVDLSSDGHTFTGWWNIPAWVGFKYGGATLLADENGYPVKNKNTYYYHSVVDDNGAAYAFNMPDTLYTDANGRWNVKDSSLVGKDNYYDLYARYDTKSDILENAKK